MVRPTQELSKVCRVVVHQEKARLVGGECSIVKNTVLGLHVLHHRRQNLATGPAAAITL